jgi:hypothetical protein
MFVLFILLVQIFVLTILSVWNIWRHGNYMRRGHAYSGASIVSCWIRKSFQLKYLCHCVVIELTWRKHTALVFKVEWNGTIFVRKGVMLYDSEDQYHIVDQTVLIFISLLYYSLILGSEPGSFLRMKDFLVESTIRSFWNVVKLTNQVSNWLTVRGCIQKFPEWPPGARTANGTALCRYMQLYR